MGLRFHAWETVISASSQCKSAFSELLVCVGCLFQEAKPVDSWKGTHAPPDVSSYEMVEHCPVVFCVLWLGKLQKGQGLFT